MVLLLRRTPPLHLLSGDLLLLTVILVRRPPHGATTMATSSSFLSSSRCSYSGELILLPLLLTVLLLRRPPPHGRCSSSCDLLLTAPLRATSPPCRAAVVPTLPHNHQRDCWSADTDEIFLFFEINSSSAGIKRALLVVSSSAWTRGALLLSQLVVARANTRYY